MLKNIFRSKKEVIFIHIPKNAGTSVGRFLGNDNPTHIKAFELIKQNNLDFFKNKYSFGIVRNPFDRFLSLYNYSRMEISFYHNNLNPKESRFGIHLDYDLLKNANVNQCAKFLEEGKLKHDTRWNQWQPQYTWLFDESGEKQLVDRIYNLEKIEDLQKDLMKMGYRDDPFPNINCSINQDYTNVLDFETRSILENFYKNDLELFNYTF